jgi:hypothetical protein
LAFIGLIVFLNPFDYAPDFLLPSTDEEGPLFDFTFEMLIDSSYCLLRFSAISCSLAALSAFLRASSSVSMAPLCGGSGFGSDASFDATAKGFEEVCDGR